MQPERRAPDSQPDPEGVREVQPAARPAPSIRRPQMRDQERDRNRWKPVPASRARQAPASGSIRRSESCGSPGRRRSLAARSISSGRTGDGNFLAGETLRGGNTNGWNRARPTLSEVTTSVSHPGSALVACSPRAKGSQGCTGEPLILIRSRLRLGYFTGQKPVKGHAEVKIELLSE
jgi:hypothetical protein